MNSSPAASPARWAQAIDTFKFELLVKELAMFSTFV
jgi:hypothetical protein